MHEINNLFYLELLPIHTHIHIRTKENILSKFLNNCFKCRRGGKIIVITGSNIVELLNKYKST